MSIHDPRYLVFLSVIFFVMVGVVTFLVPTQKTRMKARLASLSPREQISTGASMKQAGKKPLDVVGAWLAKSPLVGAAERAKMVAQLNGAGILDKEAVTFFIALKFGAAILSAVLTWTLLNYFHILSSGGILRIGIYIGGALAGWRLPDMVVSRLAGGRRRKLKEGIADALDLLVICVESGLGLEQGLDRVSRDIEMANAVVAAELRVTVSEMKVLPQARDALDNFARRTGMPLIKSIVTTFVQSLQYGTPLAQALRVLSAEMRAHRLLEIEERAAQLPVWMTLPLILFILPCLFLVVGGPAAIQVMDVMKNK